MNRFFRIFFSLFAGLYVAAIFTSKHWDTENNTFIATLSIAAAMWAAYMLWDVARPISGARHEPFMEFLRQCRREGRHK